MMAAGKRRIIYLYDALCGWCYGFSPVVKRLEEAHGAQIPFEVISGGMVRGSQVQPIAEKARYILGAFGRVEALSGVKFGEAFFRDLLEVGTYVSDSLPPAAALAALRALQPGKSVAFAHDIQRAFYYEGKDLGEAATYINIAERHGIPAEDFAARWQGEESLRQAEEDFATAAAWGVQGFPTLVYDDGASLYLLAQGYRDFAPLDQMLAQILAGPVAGK
jgi:putative protein-disulfide isomerase